MTTPTATRHYWIFTADPHHYHWDTLFVKGKEMWHGAGSKSDAIRALKQVRGGYVTEIPGIEVGQQCEPDVGR